MATETKKSWLKSNIVMIPVVASILVGTFTGVRYVVTLTDTINANKIEIMNMQRDMSVIRDSNTDLKQRLARAEGTWEMAENLYRELAEKVRDMAWDIKETETNDKTVHLDRRLGICDIHDCTDHQIRST